MEAVETEACHLENQIKCTGIRRETIQHASSTYGEDVFISLLFVQLKAVHKIPPCTIFPQQPYKVSWMENELLVQSHSAGFPD